MPLARTPQVVSATSAPLKTLNDLLHTKAGRKAPDRLRDVAALVSGLSETLGMLGLDASEPQSSLQVLRRTLYEGYSLNAADSSRDCHLCIPVETCPDTSESGHEGAAAVQVGSALTHGLPDVAECVAYHRPRRADGE
jgi:cysteinyl-tRNA synthetase